MQVKKLEEEALSSSSTEDESENRIINNSDVVKNGTVPEATTSPLMRNFNIPGENVRTLERLHCDISKHLLK